MKHIVCGVLFLLPALLLSCASDSNLPVNEGETALIRLTFTQQENASSRALSTNENTINDITVLVFDSNGKLTGSSFNTFTTSPYTMNVTARTGENCTIYAIANAGSGFFSGVNTIDAFNLKYVSLTSSDPSELGDKNSNIIMFGKKTPVKITENTTIGASDGFFLSRLCTKLTFTINAATGITITGYQLCHVPMGSYITDKTSTTYYNPPSKVFKDFITVTTSGTSVTTPTYYMYENLAGTNSSSSSAALRTSTYAPTNATYLLVYAKTSNWHSTYRIYLGGTGSTDYTNYSIQRNCNYTYTITINGSGGSGVVDPRVTYALDVAAAIGNYYYSDGTWGTSASPTGKTVIGIIFSTTTSSKDQTKGWTNGYALALKNATTASAWGTSGTDTSLANIQNSTSWTVLSNDKDGYTETQTIKSTYSLSDYPAFNAALNYSVTAPSNSSKWYLPSCGQWYDIFVNLGGMNTTPTAFGNYSANQVSWLRWQMSDDGSSNDYGAIAATNINKHLSTLTDYGYTVDKITNNTQNCNDITASYWCSSEVDGNQAYDAHLYNEAGVGDGNGMQIKSITHPVRPVIAF